MRTLVVDVNRHHVTPHYDDFVTLLSHSFRKWLPLSNPWRYYNQLRIAVALQAICAQKKVAFLPLVLKCQERDKAK
jgi:hypothetical protein